MGSYRIVAVDGQFRVFDPRGRFCVAFGNRRRAERYIAEQAAAQAADTTAGKETPGAAQEEKS